MTKKETPKQRRLLLGSLTLIFMLALSVISVFAVSASNNAKPDSAREYFSFPDEVVSTGTVGVRTPVARITPSDNHAQDYIYAVFFGGDAVELCAEYEFLPERAGDYIVHYHYTGDGKTRAYSYTITVTAENGPVFEKTPSFPYAFISGRSYALPDMFAADWSSGEKKSATVTPAVKVNGTAITITDGKFTPESSGNLANAEITYTAETDGKTAVFSEVVPVLDVYKDEGKVDYKGLFVTHGFDDVTAKEGYIAFRSFGDAEIKYANILGANGLTIDFGFGDELYQAESIELTIESYEDPSVAVSIGFEKGRKRSGEGKLSLNGGKVVKKYDFKFENNKSEKFTVTVDTERSRLVGASGELLFELTEDMNGAKFNGFTGGRVKIKIGVKGLYGSSELRVYKINSQIIGNSEYDAVLPGVVFPTIAREYNVGEVITVPAVYANDVVDPAATISASVRYFTEYLNDVNGVALNKTNASVPLVFKTEKSGTVNVQYTVADASGNSYTYPFILTIIDKSAPEIAVNGSVGNSVKVGAAMALPSATATDNDGAEKILMQVIVICPNMNVKQAASSSGSGEVSETSFTFDAAGNYKIWYVATDEYGNYVREEFAVRAEE